MSKFRDYLAGRWTAQEARKEVQAYQHLADGAADRWTTASNLTFDVPVAQPSAKADAGNHNLRQGSSASSGAASSPPESAVQRAVLTSLKLNPRVAWCERMNTGALTVGDRFVKFGFVGCSDIIGQMTDGRFLAVECKRAGGRLTDHQRAFLTRVAQAGGVAVVARSVDDVMGLK